MVTCNLWLPQRSVLGPLVFLLYINDISSVVSISIEKLFADDFTIYKKIVCPANVIYFNLILQKW